MRLVILLLVGLMLGACRWWSSAGDAGEATRGASGDPPAMLGFFPLERRVDAMPGRTLLIPVEIVGAFDGRGDLRARLDDSRPLRASLVWIGAAPDAEPGWTTYRWLAPAGHWKAVAADAAALPESVGAWFAVVDVPMDAVGQGVWLRRTRIDVNWVAGAPASEVRSPRGPDRVDWSRPVSPEAARSGVLSRLVDPESKSPARRWRARLVAGTLVDAGARATGVFDDPILEAFAMQSEWRWARGLERLATIDAALAVRLARALARVVEFEDASFAPAWPTDDAALEALRLDLLDPRLSASSLVEHVRVWLDALPTSAAWVMDDAGLAGVRGVVARIGVANFADDVQLASARARLDRVAPAPEEILPVEPMRVRSFAVEIAGGGERVGAEGERGEPGGTRHRDSFAPVEVRVGSSARTLDVLSRPIACEVPGLRLGPLFGDWTLASWTAHAPRPEMSPEWATAGLLQFDAASERWTLTIECRWAGDDGRESRASPPEVVRVWLGPRESPMSVVRVSSDGIALDAHGLPAPAEVRSGPDRWTISLALPERDSEPGPLRIGIERIDSRAVRTAWPRAMLPWQAEPARACVDLSAWK